MDYKEHYDYYYNSTFNRGQNLIISYCRKSKQEDKTFNYTFNSTSDYLLSKVNLLRTRLTETYTEAFQLFEIRHSIYRRNGLENIIKNEIRSLYKKKGETQHLESFILNTARYQALNSLQINFYEYYCILEMMFKLDNYSEFNLTENTGQKCRERPLFIKLRKEVYPDFEEVDPEWVETLKRYNDQIRLESMHEKITQFSLKEKLYLMHLELELLTQERSSIKAPEYSRLRAITNNAMDGQIFDKKPGDLTSYKRILNGLMEFSESKEEKIEFLKLLYIKFDNLKMPIFKNLIGRKIRESKKQK